MIRKVCYDFNNVCGLMFGTFVGDALGAKYDGLSSESIAPLDIDKVVKNCTGLYTDDTQMNISVFEEMVENGEVNVTSLGTRFMKRYSPWRKYGGGMLLVIERWRDGEDFSEAAKSLYYGAGSYGDGAAMRAGPISAFFRLDEAELLFEQVRLSSSLTHTHQVGVDGAVLQAFTILLALNKVDPTEWTTKMYQLPIDSSFKIKFGQIDYCLRKDASMSEVVEKIGNGSDALSAVSAAIYSLVRNRNSFIDAVLYSLELGGDTDTIGAMTGAIAGALHGYDAIPEKVIEKMENETEGRDFLFELVDKACRGV